MILLLDKGETYTNISKFLFLDEWTIANYRRRYKKGGIEELVNDEYNGKRSLLTTEESLELQTHLIEKLYDNTIEFCAYVLKNIK